MSLWALVFIINKQRTGKPVKNCADFKCTDRVYLIATQFLPPSSSPGGNPGLSLAGKL